MPQKKQDTIERFISKVQVDSSTDCWNWISKKNKDGFGTFVFNGRQTSAIRTSYKLFKTEDIPNNVIIKSFCGNERCVNPDHLCRLDDENHKDQRTYNTFRKYVRVLDNGCHEWTASLNIGGYGQLSVNRRRVTAHRWAYEYHNNVKVPDGVFCCHKCDNPKCVNPEHIFLGTPKENTNDMIAKGRKPLGAKIRSAKLNDLSVTVIMEALALGHGQSAIAKYFRVSISLISLVKLGKTWCHVTKLQRCPSTNQDK